MTIRAPDVDVVDVVALGISTTPAPETVAPVVEPNVEIPVTSNPASA